MGWIDRVKRYLTVSDAYVPPSSPLPVESVEEPEAELDPPERARIRHTRHQAFVRTYAAEAVRQFRQNQRVRVASGIVGGLGGLGGAVMGITVTAAYATSQGWPVVVPAWASITGILTTVLIGALAGLYPAIRASRVSPTEALATG